MNLKKLHSENSGVQTKMMFSASEGKIISLQILKNSTLKEHITKVPSMLLCVSGTAVYKDEKNAEITLLSGDFITIEPHVKHWVDGLENCNLLLIK